MVHIPKEKRRKWDKKSIKLTFVGYDEGIKGYRCIDQESKKVIFSRDVFFLEDDNNKENMVSDWEDPDEVRENFEENNAKEDESDEEDSFQSAHESAMEMDETITPVIEPRRSQRQPKPRKFDDYITYAAHIRNHEEEPTTVKEALS